MTTAQAGKLKAPFPYYEHNGITIFLGDALEILKELPSESVDCCVTSPPYWGLRDYGVAGQLGLEKTPEEYVAKLVEVFREVRRVLKQAGTLWLNLGDTYNGMKVGNTNGTYKDHENKGHVYAKTNTFTKSPVPGLKPKDLVGIPWMTAFALRADGWYLRQDIIWAKPNPMPESVKDRCTKSHEYVFLLSKSSIYYFDQEAIKEPAISSDYDKFERKPHRMDTSTYLREGKGQNSIGARLGMAGETRNKRSVWTVSTQSYKGSHFATFPEALIEPMILAGCPENGIVLDPFIGSGTTAKVAVRLNRRCIGVELNEDYMDLAFKRIDNTQRVLIQT